MVGRGVLAPKDGRGWRLRSPNALRMIGSHNDVMEQLVNAAESSLPDEFVALETRPIMAGTRSPLSARQITDVLGDHSDQVRIVLGSDAAAMVPAMAQQPAPPGIRFVPTHPVLHREIRVAWRADRAGPAVRALLAALGAPSEPHECDGQGSVTVDDYGPQPHRVVEQLDP
jgi:hypothetical protein